MSDDGGTAVLQMEFDVTSFMRTVKEGNFCGTYSETAWNRIYNIAKTAVCDTIHNGGTFVIVVGDGKITMVQRTEAIT